ncbi:Signal peptidase I (SPase I) (Leader peptidase I) [Pseudorhizobium banfieldiae]|uniref:Signal peptidase I n=2 Tax=Pseudorhizobium TaxID=1903858 RepID=L0NCG8_9HYPH|nr:MULTISPECIES: signal peptidase I [Pseudorhizobium]CAD6603739.1 signal peptidase I [arsenite-oxidising bacterium NT-25]CAD6609917.1 signal peptidase I [Rhizobium sp. Khangiran2]CAD6610648.1 signal peptidase I [Rhizobium sp. TCK]CAD7027115.1 signal peptidase I [Pseudorhizobium halotolerans]CCF18793.1 Signal peptidase I (SPase I) (Leader peptidase I) [Pseudorhizobium banfieldiae]
MSDRADKKQQSALWENIKVIIQALLLAMVIRTVFFQPFTIPSGSMMPTLLVGDYIFVNKFAYGYSKYSLPFSPDLFDGRIFGSEPDRGDVIVFRLPTDTDVDYIKRVVGLPGDRIQVTNGVLHINGEAVPRQPNGGFTSDYRLDPGSDVPIFRETLDNGVSYDTLDQVPNSRGDDTREFIVPEGHYFFMGDNRDNSLDSRFDVGFVPAENLIGRASVIFFSVGNDTSFREFWKWPANMRWDRLFKGVE